MIVDNYSNDSFNNFVESELIASHSVEPADNDLTDNNHDENEIQEPILEETQISLDEV